MKKFFFLCMAVVAMTACSDDSSTEGGGNNGGNNGGGQTTQASLTVSPTNVDFSTDGGTSKVTITSSAAWTAEFVNDRAEDWCSIDSTSGSAGTSTLTITATANDTPDDRTASIVVKSGTLSKTINVSQKQKDALTVTSSKFEVNAEGGEVVVEVKANIDFEYAIEESAKDWISYEGTRAIQTSALVFKVAKNDDTEKREGKITIESGEFSEDVMIYQVGEEPSIVISQNEYTVPSAGETIAVEVKSNVDITVEMLKNTSWIKENTTRALSTNTYYFDIETNDEYDTRTAKIKFVNNENNLSETITITQSQKDAIVIAEDSYNIKSDGGEIEIEVNHNVEFDIRIDDNWITQKHTRGLETSKLTFVVAKNPTDKARESSITFTSKDEVISQKVFVIQGAASYHVESISLNQSKLSMMIDDEVTLEATIAPENAENKTIIWSSNNSTVASVDNGKVIAHQLGTAIITATTQDGGKTASCIISVVEIDSMIDVSFSGMSVSSGSVTFEGNLIKLTPGVKLGVYISNYSTRNIILTSFKLICGKQNTPIDYNLDEMEIPGNKRLELTVPIISTVYSPIAEITYRYDSKTYTARAQFNGTF